MTTITIPARIVRVLRESLHSQLGMAAEDIGQASHEGGRRCPHLYAEPVERFDRTRALLDLMGWKETEGDGPATINLATHRLAVLLAFDRLLDGVTQTAAKGEVPISGTLFQLIIAEVVQLKGAQALRASNKSG